LRTIFDIGLYDGSDTAYYLESGFRVVAVEANPTYVKRAHARFEKQIAAGRLIIVHAAIVDRDGPVNLIMSGDDAGSSSVLSDWVDAIQPIGSYTVPGMRFADLLAQYGTPYFLKVDIEGADRYCILSLTSATSPPFLSFEIGRDFEELFAHVRSLGFTRFKIIDQGRFRNLAGETSIGDRISLRLVHWLGYADARSVRRAGRFFGFGSSGPLPWKSDGRWITADAALSLWRERSAAGRTPNWYDLHATRTP
jgi:FkbM family methyltransferase